MMSAFLMLLVIIAALASQPTSASRSRSSQREDTGTKLGLARCSICEDLLSVLEHAAASVPKGSAVRRTYDRRSASGSSSSSSSSGRTDLTTVAWAHEIVENLCSVHFARAMAPSSRPTSTDADIVPSNSLLRKKRGDSYVDALQRVGRGICAELVEEYDEEFAAYVMAVDRVGDAPRNEPCAAVCKVRKALQGVIQEATGKSSKEAALRAEVAMGGRNVTLSSVWEILVDPDAWNEALGILWAYRSSVAVGLAVWIACTLQWMRSRYRRLT